MTVAAWLEDWITKSLAARDRKQTTADLYATLACTHLVPTVGTIPLGSCARPGRVAGLVALRRHRAQQRATAQAMSLCSW